MGFLSYNDTTVHSHFNDVMRYHFLHCEMKSRVRWAREGRWYTSLYLILPIHQTGHQGAKGEGRPETIGRVGFPLELIPRASSSCLVWLVLSFLSFLCGCHDNDDETVGLVFSF